jgi:hypothetical protein
MRRGGGTPLFSRDSVTSLRQKHYGAAGKHGFTEVFFEDIRDIIRDMPCRAT